MTNKQSNQTQPTEFVPQFVPPPQFSEYHTTTNASTTSLSGSGGEWGTVRSSRQTPLPPLGTMSQLWPFFFIEPFPKEMVFLCSETEHRKEAILRSLFNICKKDVRSKTGTNIKETLQLTEKPTFEEMNRNVSVFIKNR